MVKEITTHSSTLAWQIHGWKSLVGYSLWGRKGSDMTEQLHFLSLYSSFWRRNWQSTPVFLPEESHGQRGLVGYSLWGCKESDMTKQVTHTHTQSSPWYGYNSLQAIQPLKVFGLFPVWGNYKWSSVNICVQPFSFTHIFISVSWTFESVFHCI